MIILYRKQSFTQHSESSTWKWEHVHRGMDIPGDRVEEEEWDIEGVSSDGYRTPPDFVPASDFSSPPFVGKTGKRRKTREAFYNGYGVVYLPGQGMHR